MKEEDDPCCQALDDLWNEIILKNRPNYGDWEYPGQAYRHIKEEYWDAIKQRDELLAALNQQLTQLQLLANLIDDETALATIELSAEMIAKVLEKVQ